MTETSQITRTDTAGRDHPPSDQNAPHSAARTTAGPSGRAAAWAANSLLLLLVPELLFAAAMWSATRRRLHDTDSERGDTVQWVIMMAIGAAIAVTVGTIVFTKLQSKANSIDVTTPGAR